MIAVGAWLWAIGDVYWNFKLANLDEIPYPSLADFFYVSGYPAFYAGLAMLTHVRLNRFEKSVWLDGLIGALAVAAIGAAFLYPALQGSTDGERGDGRRQPRLSAGRPPAARRSSWRPSP